MPKESPTFPTIRTPSSYPASHKRYFRGDHADMRVPYREVFPLLDRLIARFR